ncbi:hypothetical protein BH10PSE6_BH10PSE6_10400 [soil metagenome]
MTVEDAVEALAREPLRHVVLLKQLVAYPQHVTVDRVSEAKGAATLVALDTPVSAYGRQAYPKASIAAFIASDHPDLTSLLMPHVPRGVGIVFKLDSEADVAPLQAHFPVRRRTALVSFTSAGVVAAAGHRRGGLAARVVRTALAELGKRGLAPRYQVEEHNTASIALARSVGLAPFVTITHYTCDA